MSLDVRVLGTVRVVRDGTAARLSRQAGEVLALLVLRHPAAVPLDHLVDALWTGAPPKSAKAHVHGLLSELRRALGRSSVELVAFGYGLRLPGGAVDLRRFVDALDEARRLRETGRWQFAAQRYAEAFDQWTGPPCDGVDLPAVRALIEPLVRRYADALEEWAELALRSGGPAGGARVAELLYPAVAEHPYRERMRGLLMQALHQAGRTAEALTVYERVRLDLAEELGISPSAPLRELYQRLLGGSDLRSRSG